jgi:nucleotide-binding universal stress UspA family protein
VSESPSEPPLSNRGEEPHVIVAAVDSSTSAERVVAMAARVARAFPATSVHVVHVFRVSRLSRGHAWSENESTDALADAKDSLDACVRAAKAQCRNDVVGHFAVGDPSSEILRLLTELRGDLLVIGTHDHAGFERLLLGSIAETLTRKAGCSVLVVRPTLTRSA